MGRARVVEDQLAGLRWLSISGAADEVFQTLGLVARDDVRAVVYNMPERPGLASFAESSVGQARRAAVVAATVHHHPRALGELRDLAAGASVSFDDLLLMNLRGDLGVEDGTGCTDLAWRSTCSYLAHNEDGAPALADHLMVLTLHMDGEPAVTTHWYPGFLPANTVTATSAGLVWGIDHVQTRVPATAAGRHFVARDLQRLTTLASALDFLRTHPSAGGFAYTIGDCRTSELFVVESAAGKHRQLGLEPGAYQWHTNHLRHLVDQGRETPESAPVPQQHGASARGTGQLGTSSESIRRGTALAEAGGPVGKATEWFTQILTGTESGSVFRTAADGDPLMTLTTTVVNLSEETVMVRTHRGDSARIGLPRYLRL